MEAEGSLNSAAEALQTLLLIEDDALVHASLCRVLPRLDPTLRIVVAVDHEQVLAELERETPDYAVVDHLLRGGNLGTRWIAVLKKLNPRMRVLVLSGHMSLDYTARAMAAGADAVLAKPISARALLDVLYGRELRTVPDADDSVDAAVLDRVNRVYLDCGGNKARAAARLRISRRRLDQILAAQLRRSRDTDCLQPSNSPAPRPPQ